MEFNLDIDPNVYVRYNLYETTIRFAPANLGSDRYDAGPEALITCFDLSAPRTS